MARKRAGEQKGPPGQCKRPKQTTRGCLTRVSSNQKGVSCVFASAQTNKAPWCFFVRWADSADCATAAMAVLPWPVALPCSQTRFAVFWGVWVRVLCLVWRFAAFGTKLHESARIGTNPEKISIFDMSVRWCVGGVEVGWEQDGAYSF